MIITQRYHSASEIDSEFIPGIESLLRDRVPSFEWIINFEKAAPENTHFNYYLFFGNKHNAPIGYAQVCIEPKKDKKKHWWNKVLHPKKHSSANKTAHWLTPGPGGDGIIFEPLYLKDGMHKAYGLITDFFERDDIAELDVIFDQHRATEAFQNAKNSDKQEALSLLKNTDSYQSYLNTLETEPQKRIKKLWKFIHNDRQLRMGEYATLKDAFAYRKSQADIYRSLKKGAKVKPFLAQKTNYLTLETDKKIYALIFLVQGKHGHYFFDWLTLDEDIPGDIIVQVCIMKFYETAQADRLHYLGYDCDVKTLYEMDFDGKKQLIFTLSKGA